MAFTRSRVTVLQASRYSKAMNQTAERQQEQSDPQ
ncbi:uncharacterized protein METZ01_LOCUS73218 [marine metagenome]|uniref:Uncharacterized protein n=1 Tax=marine metagenome TaxID=408172 RepID=A0A381TX46_9ZZZZ